MTNCEASGARLARGRIGGVCLAPRRNFDGQIVRSRPLRTSLSGLDPIDAAFTDFSAVKWTAGTAIHVPGRRDHPAGRIDPLRVRYLGLEMLPLLGSKAVCSFWLARRKLNMHTTLRIKHGAAMLNLRSGETRRQSERGGKDEDSQPGCTRR
jgi:hypothetical protein